MYLMYWKMKLYEYEAKVGDGLERVDETTADLHVPLRGEYVHGRKLFLLFRNNTMGTAIYGNAEKGIWHIERYTPDKRWYYACILCIDVVLSIGMYGLLKNGLSTKAYIISSLVIGILFALILTPDSQDDEFRHLVRAYDISQGHIITHQIDSKENMKGNAIGELYGHFPYAEIPAEMDAQRMTDQSINYDNTSYQAEINLSASRERMQTILAEDEEQGTNMVCPFMSCESILLLLLCKNCQHAGMYTDWICCVKVTTGISIGNLGIPAYAGFSHIKII